jgi:hypothetical protein
MTPKLRSISTRSRRSRASLIVSGHVFVALLDEHGDDAGGHEVGHCSGEHGAQTEAGEVVTAVGDEGAYAADLHAD